MSFVTAKRDIVLESAPPLLVPGKSRQRPVTSGQATGRLGTQERARVLNKSDKKRLEDWGKEGFFFTEPRKINPASWQPHHVGKSGLPWVERCDHARRANLRPSYSTSSANATFLLESSRQHRHSKTSGMNLHSDSESTALPSANNGSKSHRELLRADHVFRRLSSAEASTTQQSSQVKKKNKPMPAWHLSSNDNDNDNDVVKPTRRIHAASKRPEVDGKRSRAAAELVKARRASGLFTSRDAQIAALYDQHSTTASRSKTNTSTSTSASTTAIATTPVATTGDTSAGFDTARKSSSDFAGFALHARQPVLVPAECLPAHRRPQAPLLAVPPHALTLTKTARRRQEHQQQGTIDLDTAIGRNAATAFTVRPPTRTALMAARKAALVATGEQYLDARRLLLGLK